MDVTLGVAVSGPVARLALVGSGADGNALIDESVVDLGSDAVDKLAETVVGTHRMLAAEDHRLVGTRLCWSDQTQAAELLRALDDSGVQNVAVVPESEAATALLGTADSTSPVPVDDPDMTMARGAAMVAGSATMTQAAIPADDLTVNEPAAEMTDSAPELAYSMADDASELLPME